MPRAGLICLLIYTLLLVVSQVASNKKIGPWVQPTEGEPWPMPTIKDIFDRDFQIHPDRFDFQITNENCDILEKAIRKYKDILMNDYIIAEKLIKHKKDLQQDETNDFENIQYINQIQIHVNNPCEMQPHINMNETYDLIIPNIDDHETAILICNSVWGALRGLETFSQLIVPTSNGLIIRMQRIRDFPKLPHRGLLIDTGRHFIPVQDILLTLDGMSYNKLNVLHWHIVDDNSFPYLNSEYPELAKKGAFHPLLVYTPKDMKMIVEYARLLGIRVIPEFDSPGHTESWGLSYPELLSTCYNDEGQPNGKRGPVDPTKSVFYNFATDLFLQSKIIFKDRYFHIGGDEVPYDCWKSNPKITKFMKKRNITGRYEKLEELHHKKLMNALKDDIIPIVWQEVFDRVKKLYRNTVVQIWTGDWRKEIAAVTNAGYPAILSTCYYLNYIAQGGDWIKFYECDPLDFPESFVGQKKLVMGGEACMWTEFVDQTNIHSRMWPRASAVAERLWSVNFDNIENAASRLEEHACRMNRRGIPAQPPNGPGFCIT
ncbi:PREDICTED: beta-hexosaminidase subunit beta-like [Ceratosolen solmsi marchali]|uniref:Beta-hexosaminidase n=1 Tax=Ceratosolen solmsi marchali TaxID=326594 RepID=A0AAJ6YJ69_9HYME|nr:PREDICTED: beta-hexosaminidase subunit beta-like [Ceratosolen solmsi marchali]